MCHPRVSALYPVWVGYVPVAPAQYSIFQRGSRRRVQRRDHIDIQAGCEGGRSHAAFAGYTLANPSLAIIVTTAEYWIIPAFLVSVIQVGVHDEALY
ncbi:hypothetical protein BDV39DRAFT_143316 [Aspergillus sergii]|uniref:Uncharacterized protein n=1 Tax=Aspergillus sergii TaxID=1034303 RepID=A0A5N6WQA9_9EURO|nr:hypothetical protein BDV39DRAFT_143316 [Aspergillus sergii]